MTLSTNQPVTVATALGDATEQGRRCGYCLGTYHGERDSGEWCGGACRTAAYRAREYDSHADLPMASERRRTSSSNATGHYLDGRETLAADLRARALARRDRVTDDLDEFTLGHWLAVSALPGERLGLDVVAWAELGARLERRRDEVRAWLAQVGAE